MQKEIRKIINRSYPFSLIPLNYEEDSFPSYFMTPEIFSYHRNKHHIGYINKLNGILEASDNEILKKMALEELIEFSRSNQEVSIFNNAGQVWNHDFFWFSISPENQNKEQTQLWKLIVSQYDSWNNFVEIFTNASLNHFGSGWSWLVQSGNQLSITTTSNAEMPLGVSVHPIFTCDLWEHAYYLAFKNDRGRYVKTMLNEFLNWNVLEENHVTATKLDKFD
jgi:Fe-Mn family superoxide dismutase